MKQLPAQVDLPAVERDVLARWERSRVFERSLEATQDGEPWVFYEGPPTANGKPGTHHVEARVFKDLFPRFKTMQGRHVPRKAGWDCHGLPVELAVEKELGFSGKQDIEAYGVAEFNARCRESVLRHVDEFERMTTRMGYWCDMDDAYRTMDSSYVESVWWSLKQIADQGLLVEDHRVAPYCPRCGTGLSDHEVAQGYQTVTDPSVYVRFPVTSGPLQSLGAALLVWTTTPWTLVSNTAVAVNPGVTYVAARAGGEVLVVAEPLLSVLGEDVEVLERFPGTALEHTTYARPFDLVEIHGRPLRRHRRLRDDRLRDRAGPPVPRLRRGGHARRQEVRPAGRQPGPPGRHLRGAPAAGRRAVLQGRRQGARAGPRRARAALPPAAVRAQLPALLALRHRAALLRAAQLVHPHHRHQGPAGRGERAHDLVPGHDQARAVRRLARQQHRLGAVPQPLLGHSPADLALHGGQGPLAGVRQPGRARRGRRAGAVRARPAPAVRRRRRRRRVSSAAPRPAGCPRSSTAGTTPARCRSPRSATRTPASSRPTRRSSSARRSTRPAAGSTRS